MASWTEVAQRVVDWHGSTILLALSTGWVLSTRTKQKEVHRIRRGKGCSVCRLTCSATDDALRDEAPGPASSDPQWPSVCVIVPAKGVKDGSVRNWLSFREACAAYPGECRLFFCVESESDPACEAVRRSLSQDDAEVVVCGKATCCSQKLHNIVGGISRLRGCDWDAKYALFLDDDVCLHGELIGNFVETLEHNDGAFMCTAYPFDVPAEKSGFVTRCVAAYHLRLIIAFSVSAQTNFVWGGCMMYRSRDLFSNAHGLVSCWENGGYSDDLIASATCQAKKLKIVCNPSNVLQQRLPRFTTIRAYWNYTCRQVFVLDTYVSAWHKTLNRGLIAIHVYLSAFFVAAVASNCFRYAALVVRLLAFLVRVSLGHSEWYQLSVRIAYVRLVGWTQRNLSVVFFFLCLCLCLRSLRAFASSMDALFFELYSGQDDDDGRGTVKNRGAAKASCQGSKASGGLTWNWPHTVSMFAALCVDVGLFVPAAAKALVSDEIEWSGVVYTKRKGLISKVKHR